MAQSIGLFSLTNSGGFAVELQFDYFDTATSTWIKMNGTGMYPNPQTRTLGLQQYGCPNGATVRIHADVVWGIDKVGDESFTCDYSNTNVATYVISGASLTADLKFLGVTVPA